MRSNRDGIKAIVTAGLLAMGLFGVVGLTACTGIEEPVSAPAQAEAKEVKEPAADKPKVVQEEVQARNAAEGYLSAEMGFSYDGLIDQLSSEYANKFPRETAKKVVDSLDVDWNEQAVIKANGYLDTGMGFSRQGLIDQLTSDYADKFTVEQATYAADQVGL